jgi:molybdopterin-binding protein
LDRPELRESRGAVDELGLTIGSSVVTLVKSTEISLATD